MSPASDVHQLLRVALDQFDRPGNTVSASARRAVRIAALRRDHGNQLWLQWELTDLEAGRSQKRQDPAISRIIAQLDALLGAEEGGRERRRAFLMFERTRTFLIDGEEMFQGHSLGQIEQSLAMSRRVYDDLTVPTNLTAVDAYFVAKDMDSARPRSFLAFNSKNNFWSGSNPPSTRSWSRPRVNSIKASCAGVSRERPGPASAAEGVGFQKCAQGSEQGLMLLRVCTR